MTQMQGRAWSRRGVLAVAGAGVVGALTIPATGRATPQEADDFARKILGGATAKSGKVQLIVKDVAESGANEPVRVVVGQPDDAPTDHVKAIHVLADGNPFPGVSSWFLNPEIGQGGCRLPHAPGQDPGGAGLCGDVRRLGVASLARGQGHHRRLRRLRPHGARNSRGTGPLRPRKL